VTPIFSPTDFTDCETPEEIAHRANTKILELKAGMKKFYSENGDYMWFTFKSVGQKVRTAYVFEIEDYAK
jgi:hypothetical protein